MTTSPPGSAARTMLPSSTRRRPTCPLIGAVIRECNLRLVGVDGALKLPDLRALAVKILLRNQTLRVEQVVPLELDLSVLQLRLISLQLGLCLRELYLEGTAIDFRQQVALIYKLTLPERRANK